MMRAYMAIQVVSLAFTALASPASGSSASFTHQHQNKPPPLTRVHDDTFNIQTRAIYYSTQPQERSLEEELWQLEESITKSAGLIPNLKKNAKTESALPPAMHCEYDSGRKNNLVPDASGGFSSGARGEHVFNMLGKRSLSQILALHCKVPLRRKRDATTAPDVAIIKRTIPPSLKMYTPPVASRKALASKRITSAGSNAYPASTRSFMSSAPFGNKRARQFPSPASNTGDPSPTPPEESKNGNRSRKTRPEANTGKGEDQNLTPEELKDREAYIARDGVGSNIDKISSSLKAVAGLTVASLPYFIASDNVYAKGAAFLAGAAPYCRSWFTYNMGQKKVKDDRLEEWNKENQRKKKDAQVQDALESGKKNSTTQQTKIEGLEEQVSNIAKDVALNKKQIAEILKQKDTMQDTADNLRSPGSAGMSMVQDNLGDRGNKPKPSSGSATGQASESRRKDNKRPGKSGRASFG